jgi:hypothetical protein
VCECECERECERECECVNVKLPQAAPDDASPPHRRHCNKVCEVA